MTPNSQSVCKHCQKQIAFRGNYWLQVETNGYLSDEFCKGNRNGRHEPTEPASLNAPAGTEGQEPIRLPFQKALTVVMLPPEGDRQADKDIAAIEDGSSTVIRVDVSELYLCQLRLRVEKDPSLKEKIAVFYKGTDGILQPVGLSFDDELKWPVGFCQELWSKEVEIGKARHDKQ